MIVPHKNNTTADTWDCLLELDANRNPVAGGRRAVCDALGRGADLRLYSEWYFEEHVAPELGRPASDDERGLCQEVIDFRQVIRVGDDDAAGVTTLRQAILPILGFNPSGPARMSFFKYNVDGSQGCANVLLDDNAPINEPGRTQVVPAREDMPKMSEVELHDEGTKAPSANFVYDFERYRFFVRDDWRELLDHEADGAVNSGSFKALHEAHHAGCELKVAIRDLADGAPHEVFSLVGTTWIHTGRGELEALTHPLVRIIADTPLKYTSGRWDVAWIFLSTSGEATLRRLDPYRRTFTDRKLRLACRWFAR